MKEILALWMARNREYYRDKGSLFWSFIATPFIVIVLALAFSSESQHIFRVGQIAQETASAPKTDPFEKEPFSTDPTVEIINYNDLQHAIRRVQFHQLDLLLDTTSTDTQKPRYWINSESAKGHLLEKLLIQNTEDQYRETRYREPQWQRE